MKKLLLGLLAIILLLVVIVVAAPFLIPTETYRQQIVQAVEGATGRKLTIAGDFGLSILPRLGLSATNVSLSNVPGAEHPNMLELGKLVVALQVWPLLSGQVKIDSFVLEQPAIHLQVDEQGRPNWVFAAVGETAPEAQAPKAGAEGGAEGGGLGARMSGLSLGDVRLDDGSLTYRDARTGQTAELGDIDLAVSLPDLDSPVSAKGDVTWNGREIALAVQSQRLRGLLEGGAAPLQATVENELFKLAFAGQIGALSPPKLDGKLDLDVSSARELAAWTGNPVALPGDALYRVGIHGNLAFGGGQVSFADAKVALDEIAGQGQLTLDTGGAKPKLTARLDLGEVDLNPYLPPEEEEPAAAGGGGGATPAPADAGWSDAPYDFSALNSANAALELNVGGIRLREIAIGRSALAATLQDGQLTLDLRQLALYDGSGTGRAVLNARGATPAAETALTLEGVDVGQLLRDAGSFDRLDGKGNVALSLATQGASQRAMVGALGGDASIKLADGAIRGINLAAVLRDATAILRNPQDLKTGDTEKTDFAELSASFKVAKGVAQNDDLLLLNPLLRVTGEGRVDLPQRSLHYRVVPKLVASLQGQGGATGLKGVAVPIVIDGPWTSLSYRPDLSGAVEQLAKDPSGALKQLQEGGVEDVLKGLTGKPAEQGGSQPSAEPEQPQESGKPDPEKLLKGLFGR